MAPQLSKKQLENHEYQGAIVLHNGKKYMILYGKLEELTKIDEKVFERMTFETRNSLIRNNLLA